MLASRVAAIAAQSLIAGSLVSASPVAAAPAAVTVSVWSFGFAPAPIYLHAGQEVTLTFVNRSGSSHDFTAHDFFMSSRIVSGDAREGEVELRGHETKSVTLIPRAGTYHAHCSHFMHKQMGMHDEIIVN